MCNLVCNFITWQSSLRRYLHKISLSDNWDRTWSVFNEYSHMLTMELTAFQNIALHVAIEWNSSAFIEGLLSIMTTEDLEIRNLDKDMAICHWSQGIIKDFQFTELHYLAATEPCKVCLLGICLTEWLTKILNCCFLWPLAAACMVRLTEITTLICP